MTESVSGLIDWKEIASKSGTLIMITGKSSSGKDTVTGKLRESPHFAHLNLTQIVTTASRKPRPNEVHGREYYFSDLDVMKEMEKRGEFIEILTQTGASYDIKATETKEILPVIYSGETRIWRADLSRSADVAKGGYFYKYLKKEEADILESRTIVVLIESDPNLDTETIMNIRKERDKEKFDRATYEIRDKEEQRILKKHGHHFKHRVVNKWNQLDSTVSEVSDLLLNFINSR